MRVAITGATGFVGSAAAAALKRDGHDVVPISSPRLSAQVLDAQQALATSLKLAPDLERSLGSALSGVDVLLNCAGLAAPDSARTPELLGANAVLPAVLYLAAARHGVARYIHVSSAAVQGRRPLIDETFEHEIRSPYAESKGLAESTLMMLADAACELRIYRATSVQETGRGVTDALLRLAHLPVVPVVGAGDHSLPLSLRRNCAAAIAHLAATPRAPVLNVHPWEGMTPSRFFRLVNPWARLVRMPRALAEFGDETLWQLAPHASAAAALAKRADLLVNGQRSVATAMARTAFRLPGGDDDYVTMGEAWRDRRGLM